MRAQKANIGIWEEEVSELTLSLGVVLWSRSSGHKFGHFFLLLRAAVAKTI